MAFWLAVVEGALEEQIAASFARHFGFSFGAIANKRGGQNFWREAHRFDQAARHRGPVLGLVDLEHAPCASGLIVQKLGRMPHGNFALRVAVRTMESWLLADTRGIAKYLRVAAKDVPNAPDAEGDPKQRLVNLARKSGKREIRDGLVPPDDVRGAKVGREYLPVMGEFVRSHWDIGAAAERSPSLRRALAAIEARL